MCEGVPARTGNPIADLTGRTIGGEIAATDLVNYLGCRVGSGIGYQVIPVTVSLHVRLPAALKGILYVEAAQAVGVGPDRFAAGKR